MKTIWKYPLELIEEQEINAPVGAQILTVQAQNEQPCLWALVDDDDTARHRLYIRIHGTGHGIPNPDKMEYISTFQLAHGSIVFHVFKDVS